jgi:hypothetical protein
MFRFKKRKGDAESRFPDTFPRELPRRKAAAYVTLGLKINRAIARLNLVMRPLRRSRLSGFTAARNPQASSARPRCSLHHFLALSRPQVVSFETCPAHVQRAQEVAAIRARNAP